MGNQQNLLDRIIDAVNARQDRERRQGCRFLVIVVSIFIVLAIVGVIISAILSAIEEANVVKQYGDDIASLCQPPPVGLDSLENMPQGETPYRILLLDAGSKRRHDWFAQLPSTWRAEDEEAVALVGCVEEERETIETCTYERASARSSTYTVRIERQQFTTTLILLNVDSGRRIASHVVDGASPRECPADDESVTGSSTIVGEKAPLGDFASWLEPFIFGD
ncbi:MAG: hypothetical protein Q9P44_19750 [Anaerolineae bacterium]|nr:hypothetical protein [Anaerolineae bacterium]